MNEEIKKLNPAIRFIGHGGDKMKVAGRTDLNAGCLEPVAGSCCHFAAEFAAAEIIGFSRHGDGILGWPPDATHRLRPDR